MSKTGENGAKQAGKGGNDREARLKAALKANMGRRKAQARARSAADDAGTHPDTKKESS
ncbi:MAG: hypothetical protein AAFO58_04990 [Pseudomonadota bacterium]